MCNKKEWGRVIPKPGWRAVKLSALLSLVVALLVACNNSSPSAPAPPPLAKELVFYSWAEYMPPAVLDEFAKELWSQGHL
ncbi:MAG TPA: hypothetical protein VES89_03860 [Candidatus Competibacteraceae bacterium]|nr:hypothetical protein [Candidatus Competibacteraceae bacterium]